MKKEWKLDTYIRSRLDVISQSRLFANYMNTYDYVARYEEWQLHWYVIHKKLGLPRYPVVLNSHAERNPDYRTYYTDDLAKHVATQEALVIKEFGYTF